MPFIPVVRVKCAIAAISAALKAEHGYRHTAIIHTKNVETATPHGTRHEHNTFHPERSICGCSWRWWSWILQPHGCNTHGRGSHDSHDVYASTPDGGGHALRII